MQALQVRESLHREQALGGENPLELVNQQLEAAIGQLRMANEALQQANHELGSLSNQLEIMNEEMESLSQEVTRLRAERQLAGGARRMGKRDFSCRNVARP